MRFFPGILFLIAALPVAAEEQRPKAGLLWKESDLPATLPLQLQTAPGADHVVFLTSPDAEEPVMAGYVRGGAFFRLLVPPGDWQISIASGDDWQGEIDLFGPDTSWTELSEPLTFRAAATTLNGHVLIIGDGSEAAEITVAPRTICRVIAGRAAPEAKALREAPQVAPLEQKLATNPRLDARDRLAHDRLTGGRIDPRDPLAHDRLTDGRLDPRDPLQHDRLIRPQAQQIARPAPIREVEPLNLPRGSAHLRSVLCD